MEYKNNNWIEIYSFPIWNWQLPEIPGTINQYGPCGLEQKLISANNDTVNKHIEQELIDFKGLVKKINTNKIQVIFRNDEAIEDTMIADLNILK